MDLFIFFLYYLVFTFLIQLGAYPLREKINEFDLDTDLEQGNVLTKLEYYNNFSMRNEYGKDIGLLYTTSGKSGFITAFYIIIVPLLGRLIGRTVRPVLWFCAGIALIGLYLICIKDGFSINKGDLWTLACAFCYAIHILVIDRFSPEVNGVALSQIQFLVAGLISIPIMFATESADPGLLFDFWLPLCYSGIMSGGVGYTLQIIAQKHTEPTVACLIMSLEAAFALLTGWLVLGETMSAKEFIGCAVMFTAIVISQRPSRESSFN